MSLEAITIASLTLCVLSCAWSFYLLRWSRKAARGSLVILNTERQQRLVAESACEELRKSVMRGSAVGRWHRPPGARNADEWYHHVLTVEGPLLLTDEAWQVARQRAGKLLK